MLKFECPSCHQKLNVSLKLAGKSAACPKCGERLQVPTEAPANLHSQAGRATGHDRHSPEDIHREDCPATDDEQFPDISEFLAPDKISASLPAPTRIKKPRARASSASKLRSTEMECLGCGKTMAKSDRYCVACGYNHFDAVETAVATQQKMHDRLEKQVGGLFMWQWLRVFSRFFR